MSWAGLPPAADGRASSDRFPAMSSMTSSFAWPGRTLAGGRRIKGELLELGYRWAHLTARRFVRAIYERQSAR